MELYVNSNLYCQNNLTNEFLDIKLVEKEVLVEIFWTDSSIYNFYYVVWWPFWIYMSMVTYNGYLYRQNNLTNEFLDLKLVEKKVSVEIFEQIVQYIICRLAAILNNACSRGMPRWSNIYPGHFHRELVPLLYMKPLRNLGYIMYTELWDKDWTT